APATDSDPDMGTGETGDIVLNSGDMLDDIDAGYYNPIDIGDKVWEDMDGNGLQDGGEPGVDGVNVVLSGTAGDGSPVNLNVNTAGGGMYTFTDVPPGDYTISFTLPSAAWFFTTQDAGADDIDSDPDRGTGDVINIMVESS